MWFQKDFSITLEKVYFAKVEGFVEVDDVTGYVYPHITEVLLEDEDGNIVHEDDEHYGELLMHVHERDYEPDHWSE